MVDWCSNAGVPLVVYVTSGAFYNWSMARGGQALKEESDLCGKTAYSDSKLSGEKFVTDSGLDFRVARLATVFGVGDRANFSKLAIALKNRRFIVPGEGSALKSVISVNRAAEYLSRLALLEKPIHRIVNLGFCDSPSLGQICILFSQHCGFPTAIRCPSILLHAAATVGDVVFKFRPSFPLTTSNVSKLSMSTRVDCSRACELFPDLKSCSFEDELMASSHYYTSI